MTEAQRPQAFSDDARELLHRIEPCIGLARYALKKGEPVRALFWLDRLNAEIDQFTEAGRRALEEEPRSSGGAKS